MAVVKLPDKADLDKLVATLTLRVGKKIPQQEVLAACIRLASTHIEELEIEFGERKTLSKKRVEEVLAMGEDFDYQTTGSIDSDLYGGAN